MKSPGWGSSMIMGCRSVRSMPRPWGAAGEKLPLVSGLLGGWRSSRWPRPTGPRFPPCGMQRERCAANKRCQGDAGVGRTVGTVGRTVGTDDDQEGGLPPRFATDSRRGLVAPGQRRGRRQRGLSGRARIQGVYGRRRGKRWHTRAHKTISSSNRCSPILRRVLAQPHELTG